MVHKLQKDKIRHQASLKMNTAVTASDDRTALLCWSWLINDNATEVVVNRHVLRRATEVKNICMSHCTLQPSALRLWVTPKFKNKLLLLFFLAIKNLKHMVTRVCCALLLSSYIYCTQTTQFDTILIWKTYSIDTRYGPSLLLSQVLHEFPLPHISHIY